MARETEKTAKGKDIAEKKPITVLAVGNLLLQDDGVGIHALRELEKLELPPEVELVDGGTAGVDLLPIIEEAENLIVIDAVRGGCEPGAVYRLPWEALQETREEALSLHQVGFLEVMELAAYRGCAPSAVIIGIEPAVIDWGLELSPAVARVLPKVVEVVCREIELLREKISADRPAAGSQS